MSLRSLTVTDFRNLKSVNIELGDRLNVFFGDNGSGKTSILESINTLSVARSFRTRKFKSIINHQSNSFTVFGRIDTAQDALLPVGVQRCSSGDGVVRVNHNTLNSTSELAEVFPVRVINSVSFAILDGAPLERRALLDWLMFHVEHGFHKVWKDYEKCIKQRNTLLRHDKIDRLMLETWDAKLVPLAKRLDAYRREAFELISQEFEALISQTDGLPGKVELSFGRGWDKNTEFEGYLKDNIERDLGLGYTRQGPHRSDIKVMVEGNLASEVLSRGQQKIVVCALLLAQGRVFTAKTNRQCAYLIDDLPAELDLSFRSQLCFWLNVMGAQVFVTGIVAEEIINAWPKGVKYKVFHVKHGTVEELIQDL